ncbi:MAG: CvpA family protein [Prevotellaceae bacterium]|nr:CvpA family protein [Prevotellaceae bacterium]
MYIDIFIAIVLAGAAWTGWKNGLLREIASSAGCFVGLFVAAGCYARLGRYLAVDGTAGNMLTSLVAFFMLWIMVPLLLGLAATLLTKALGGMKLGLPNSLLGMAVAVFKYVVLLAVVLAAMDALGILNEERAQRSRLYAPLRHALTDAVERVAGDLGSDAADGGAEADTVWIDNPNAR